MRQMQKVRRNSMIMSDSYCRSAVGKLDPTETFAVKSAMGEPDPIETCASCIFSENRGKKQVSLKVISRFPSCSARPCN